MNDDTAASSRFWDALSENVASSLSWEQRIEIDRAISVMHTTDDQQPSRDIHLSLGWFFIRIVWGSERRNPERLIAEVESQQNS